MRRFAIAAIGLVLGGAFYLLLIDTRYAPELYGACGVALLAAIVFEVSRESGFTEAAFSIGWLREAWRPLARVPVDMALVAREAVSQLLDRRPRRGVFRTIEFAGGTGPRDAGRRALTEVLGSLAPNTIVIGIDPERGLLLVHQLRRDGPPDRLDVLRLG
jgi:hypothetical protein